MDMPDRSCVPIPLILAGALCLSSGCDKSRASLFREARVEQEQDRAQGTLHPQSEAAWDQAAPSVLQAKTAWSGKGVTHRFSLALPKDWRQPTRGSYGFDNAQIERFVVRLPSGSQESVQDLGTRQGDELVYTYPELGTMLSSICVLEPSQGDAPRGLYCQKRVYDIADGTRKGEVVPSSTARLGDLAELRPMLPPEQLVPGSDFPVMAYLGGERARNVLVHAFAPDGQVITARTGHAGIADIRIHAFGDWKIRVAGTVKGAPMVAELEFTNKGEW